MSIQNCSYNDCEFGQPKQLQDSDCHKLQKIFNKIRFYSLSMKIYWLNFFSICVCEHAYKYNKKKLLSKVLFSMIFFSTFLLFGKVGLRILHFKTKCHSLPYRKNICQRLNFADLVVS